MLIQGSYIHMKIRVAEPEHALDILCWRNDNTSRIMSRREDMISVEEHMAWFNNLLQDPDKVLLIGFLLDKPIGMVRFDRLCETKSWEISIVVNPANRGQGIGKTLLSYTLQHFSTIFSQARLIAEMKSENITSRKLFESLGFVLQSDKQNLLVFSREINGLQMPVNERGNV